MRTNSSMTVYSKSVVGGVDSWSRFIIPAVEWENARIATTLQAGGTIEGDKVSVFIPITPNNFTINPGDYIVKGSVYDDISSTFTISDLKRKYSTAAVVREVNKLDFGSPALQHWEIGAN